MVWASMTKVWRLGSDLASGNRKLSFEIEMERELASEVAESVPYAASTKFVGRH
jgi:hypothetical protein